MNPNIERLNQRIESMPDANDKAITMAMFVILVACEVGTDVARIAHETGFARSFIEKVATNMQQAGLWVSGYVDDLEWRDENGDPIGERLFAHGFVALGKAKRIRTLNGYLYVDAATCAVLGEYSDSEKLS